MAHEDLLTQVNHKLDRLLAILEPKEAEDDALYLHCVREILAGNRKPMDAYLRRGGKVPQKYFQTTTKEAAGARKSAKG
jgi:hypothetical protein